MTTSFSFYFLVYPACLCGRLCFAAVDFLSLLMVPVRDQIILGCQTAFHQIFWIGRNVIADD